MQEQWRHLEINGGRVISDDGYRLSLQPGYKGYSDAQLDDYGGKRRQDYLWMPNTIMRIKARFSHAATDLKGTAGFGFWNSPFGDPTVFWPALPRAVWFFFASYPSDLPLNLEGPGRGWFVSTIDAKPAAALYLAPLSLPILMLNNISGFRKRLWPRIRQKLNITYTNLKVTLEHWHHYRLIWHDDRCRFLIDELEVATTECSPRGPLGFVCWMDNQYLIATNRGRLRWGVLSVTHNQWLEVKDLQIQRF